jgi:hypothetical protein
MKFDEASPSILKNSLVLIFNLTFLLVQTEKGLLLILILNWLEKT